MRNDLYKLLRIMNDINAIMKGKYFQRLMRKHLHKRSGNFFNNLFK